MRAPAAPLDIDEDNLAQLVAAIRARGTGQALPSPAPAAVAAAIAHLRGEQSMGAGELAEHERQWRAVEEIRAVDRVDEQAERLL